MKRVWRALVAYGVQWLWRLSWRVSCLAGSHRHTTWTMDGLRCLDCGKVWTGMDIWRRMLDGED